MAGLNDAEIKKKRSLIATFLFYYFQTYLYPGGAGGLGGFGGCGGRGGRGGLGGWGAFGGFGGTSGPFGSLINFQLIVICSTYRV